MTVRCLHKSDFYPPETGKRRKMTEMKRFLSLFAAVLMLLSALTVFASAESELPFRDVPEGKWYYPHVLSMYRRGLMEGESPTFFAPRIPMTRAEFVTVLSRAVGADVEGCSSVLAGVSDADEDAWYADAPGWAIREGFVKGYTDGTVKPDAPIVRQEMAVLLGRYLRYIGAELPDNSVTDAFTDAASFPKWAKGDIDLLRRSGVAQGDDRGAFLPARETLRCEVAAFLDRILTVIESITPPDPDDPVPENLGYSVDDPETGIKVSKIALVGDENGAIPSCGVGTHGGHEMRVVRTENGTYATYLIRESGSPTEAHPSWDYGEVEFALIKITPTGSRVIFTDVYPQAMGSCTPNVLRGENGKLYVTALADDKERPWGRGGAWLRIYEVDTSTDEVTHVGRANPLYETSGYYDHGYGYTMPIIDVKHGKLYGLYCGGDVPGYMVWYNYDLNTGVWDTTCHTATIPSRDCYINGYPDGAGGFSFVVQRDITIGGLKQLTGFDFTSTSGYIFDALYLYHAADPDVPALTETVVREPVYTSEGYKNTGKNRIDSISHYGEGGCTYLDRKNRLHVIYTHKVGNESTRTVYHAVYSADGTEIMNEPVPKSLLPNNGTRKMEGEFAMTQGKSGKYYILYQPTYGYSGKTMLGIFSSSDGLSFTEVTPPTELTDAAGNSVEPGKLSVGNSRNRSLEDGIIPVLFNGSGNVYYYYSVRLP